MAQFFTHARSNNMPSAVLKSLADKSGKDLERAEHLWDKAKGIVSIEYKITKKSKKFWPLVVGITKKMLGLKEGATFKEVLAAEAEDHYE